MKARINQRHFGATPADAQHGPSSRRTHPAPAGWRQSMLVALTVTLLCAPSAQAAEPLPMLLGSPPATVTTGMAAVAPMADRSVARQRPVVVDFRYLDPQSGKAPAELGVELFDGQVVTLDRARIEQRGAGNYTWHGRVRGHDRSDAVLTVVDGQIAGSIVVVDTGLRTANTYQLQSGPGGAQTLRLLDPAGFPPDHPPGAETLRAPPDNARISGATAPDAGTPSAADVAAAAADTGDTIDVMVVYSNQTAATAGATIAAEIQQAVDRANLAYANSGVATRLRLVHYQQVSYDETGNFSTDLNRLTNGSDGYMDEVQVLRNTYGADLVSLFIENGQYCGIGWIGPNVNYAFTVVNRGCAGGNLSFAHELGHNIGALHDPYVDPSTSPYPYGHGYVYPAARWRTVMAYNDACVAAGTNCTRIAYLSNPNLSYGSPAAPMGTATTSDNARVHNQNAYTVANFRAAVGSVCTYALSPTSASAAAPGGSGSLTVTAGAGCAWDAQSDASWLTISAASATSGSGTLGYSVSANAGAARSGHISIGDQTFTLNQATACTYSLNPTSASFVASGGTGATTLATGAACAWVISSDATWLSVSSAGSGSGGTTVTYTVAANTGAARSANLTAGGVALAVTQAAPAIAKLTATSLSFGNQRVGTASAIKSVKLANNGGGALTVNALTAAGANPADFIRSGTCAVGTTLPAGQTCTVGYTFKPTAKGGRSASLAIATSGGTVTLGLSGTGK